MMDGIADEPMPCPFCGCHSVEVQEIMDGWSEVTTAAYVVCDACAAQGPEHNSIAEAVWQWNQPTRDAEISRPAVQTGD